MKLAATAVFSLCISFAVVALASVAGPRSAGVSGAPGMETASSGQSAPAPVAYAPGFHSRWVSQSSSPTIGTGSTTTLTINFRNTGTAPWVKGVRGQQANLGLNGDGAALAAGWPTPDRLAVQNEAVVRPGEIASFTFSVRAPDARGSYRLAVRPVIDGVSWMEDEGAFIVVTGAAASPFDGILASATKLAANPFAVLMLAEWVVLVALMYLGRSVYLRIAHA